MSPRCDIPLRRGNNCDRRVGHTGSHRSTSLEGQKAYQASPKGRATHKAWRESPEGRQDKRAWNESLKGRASRKSYSESPKGRTTQKDYRESPEGRATTTAYQESSEGRAWRRSYYASLQVRESRKVIEHKRRAQKQASPIESFTAKELAAHIEAMGGRCVYCNGPYEHLDHVYPLSKVGPHALSNLVPACAPCNMRKHNMLPLHFLFPLQFTSNAP